MASDQDRVPSAELVAEARKVPGGWVYEIDGEFGVQERVPPEAIVGAWAVDESGRLTGEFVPNPRHERTASTQDP
jgi:hypothetical protein